MLRIGPGVISLTMGEVRDYEHRRRFQKDLECEKFCIRTPKIRTHQREITSVQVDPSLPSLSRVSTSPASSDKRDPPSISIAQASHRASRIPREAATAERTERTVPLSSGQRRRRREIQSLASLKTVADLERTPPYTTALDRGDGTLITENPELPPTWGDLLVRRPRAPPPTPTEQDDFERGGSVGFDRWEESQRVGSDLAGVIGSATTDATHDQFVSLQGNFIGRNSSRQDLNEDQETGGWLSNRTGIRYERLVALPRHRPPPTAEDSTISSTQVAQFTPGSTHRTLSALARAQQAREFDALGITLDAAPPATVSRTPGRFQIYNDSLPASSQPQTPQNLPEVRHQSRLRGSYTVPARHSSPHLAGTPTTGRVRRRRRNASPLGIQEPGFTGLYGGTENTDDSPLFQQTLEQSDAAGSPGN